MLNRIQTELGVSEYWRWFGVPLACWTTARAIIIFAATLFAVWNSAFADQPPCARNSADTHETRQRDGAAGSAVDAFVHNAGSVSDDVQQLIAATRAPRWKARWDAVNELGKLKDPRGVPALVERALYDTNPYPRWRSLWALKAVDRSGAASTGPLEAALRCGDPTVSHNAAIALAFYNNPAGRDVLLMSLGDERESWRWEAIFSLRSIPDDKTVQVGHGMVASRRHDDHESD